MQFRNATRLGAAIIFSLATALSAVCAQAQTAAKFSISAKPLGAATTDKMVPVAASVGVEITIKNEGSAALADITITAKLNGIKLVPEGGWTADGDNAVLKIASINANEEVSRRLTLRVEAAPVPPGSQAEVSIEGKAGETIAKASAKFAVGDCAGAFHAELAKLNSSTISEIWPTADDMRKPDTTLPRMRLFRMGMRKSNDLAVLDRIAAGYQARLLSDYEFFREGVRYTVRRWSDELKSFATQEANPGICAMNSEMVEGIRKTISYVTTRIEPPQKAYARAMDLIRKALNAGQDDDLRKIALRAAEEAGAKIENPPAEIFKLLETTRDLLKDAKPTAEQLDNLSLIESVAWIEAQALRSKKLNDLIEKSITGISEAQKKSCTCAF